MPIADDCEEMQKLEPAPYRIRNGGVYDATNKRCHCHASNCCRSATRLNHYGRPRCNEH
jgi:hypothetical protein